LSSVSFFNSLIPLDCLGLAVDISFHWPPGDGNSQLHWAQTQSETQANWTQPNWTELSVEQRSNLVIPVAVVVILMVFVVVGTFNLCLVNASGTNNNLLWRRFCRILESVYLRSSTTIFVELVVVIVGRGCCRGWGPVSSEAKKKYSAKDISHASRHKMQRLQLFRPRFLNWL